jgi:hypothetical protein
MFQFCGGSAEKCAVGPTAEIRSTRLTFAPILIAMASPADVPIPPVPNAQALLAAAVDRNGKQTLVSDALERLRGEDHDAEHDPRAAAG